MINKLIKITVHFLIYVLDFNGSSVKKQEKKLVNDSYCNHLEIFSTNITDISIKVAWKITLINIFIFF